MSTGFPIKYSNAPRIQEPAPLFAAQPVKIPEPAPLFAAQPAKIPEPAPLFAAQPVKIPEPAPLFAAQPTKVFRRGLFSKRPESFCRAFFQKSGGYEEAPKYLRTVETYSSDSSKVRLSGISVPEGARLPATDMSPSWERKSAASRRSSKST